MLPGEFDCKWSYWTAFQGALHLQVCCKRCFIDFYWIWDVHSSVKFQDAEFDVNYLAYPVGRPKTSRTDASAKSGSGNFAEAVCWKHWEVAGSRAFSFALKAPKAQRARSVMGECEALEWLSCAEAVCRPVLKDLEMMRNSNKVACNSSKTWPIVINYNFYLS